MKRLTVKRSTSGKGGRIAPQHAHQGQADSFKSSRAWDLRDLLKEAQRCDGERVSSNVLRPPPPDPRGIFYPSLRTPISAAGELGEPLTKLFRIDSRFESHANHQIMQIANRDAGEKSRASRRIFMHEQALCHAPRVRSFGGAGLDPRTGGER